MSKLFAFLLMLFATPALAHQPESQLYGFAGDQLKGAISCIHPNIIADLANRLHSREDYTHVIQLYEDQGYCIEIDLPTTLIKPLSNKVYRIWDGNEAELWETTVTLPNPDGTYRRQRAYSIVFPLVMEKTFTN